MNCIRCGRKVSDNRNFCDECTAVVQEPLPESAYISTHISIPQRRAEPIRAAAKQRLPRKSEKQYPKGLIRAVVSLSLVCALLLGACGFAITYYFRNCRCDRNLLRLQEEELARRQEEIAQMQTELETAQSERLFLEETIFEQVQEIMRLENEINTYKTQDSETD